MWAVIGSVVVGLVAVCVVLVCDQPDPGAAASDPRAIEALSPREIVELLNGLRLSQPLGWLPDPALPAASRLRQRLRELECLPSGPDLGGRS